MNRGPLLPRLLAALTLCVALSALCLLNYYPRLPSPLAVDLVLDRGTAGQSEPLIVAGRPLFGDFLFVRYVDETHVVFGYDSWGHPGQVSATPIAVTPGTPLHLRLEMPALDQMRGHFADPPGRIRVTCDGTTVFDVTNHYFFRQPLEIYLAQNPLGGTACGPQLRGRLLAPDGRELRGDPTQFFTLRDRALGWLTRSHQIYAVLLVALAVLVGWLPLAWFHPTVLRAALASTRRILALHRWFAATAAACTLVFTWMLTQGTFDFDVTEPLGSFYDYQAASLLRGRLDVPDDAIDGEAFVFDGKLYGYFGPTPALLRLPFVLFDFGFGNLTRAFLLAYFIAALTAAYALLRQVYALAGRSSGPSAWPIVLLVAHLGLGSTLFYLSSRAYVYHEAILCGVTLAFFSCLFALRHLAAPTSRHWLPALLCALLSLHARPPTGLFALTFLGCVAATHLVSTWLSPKSEDHKSRIINHLAIGLLCVVAVFTFNGLSYLKFKTFEGAPLRYSRPYDAARLAKIDGKSFHAVNLPYGAYTYLVRPNLRFESTFPWIYLGAATPPHHFEKAKIDLPDHTNALPWAMPGLFALATFGCAAAFVRVSLARTALLVTWVAVVPMTLALFTAVATSQRYTADWLPFLVGTAAFGLVAVETTSPRPRLLLRVLLSVLTLAAILITFALTLHYQRHLVWGVPEEARQSYQAFRARLTPL